MSDHPLAHVRVRGDVREPGAWYWGLPAVAQMREEGMALAPVTVLVGENGSGKSTLVEAVARAWQESLTAQVKHWGDRPFAEDASLWRWLELDAPWPRPQGGVWLRAEAMHQRFSGIDRDEFELRPFDGVPLNARSHGEGLLAFLESRTLERGLWILDDWGTPCPHHSQARGGPLQGAARRPGRRCCWPPTPQSWPRSPARRSTNWTASASPPARGASSTSSRTGWPSSTTLRGCCTTCSTTEPARLRGRMSVQRDPAYMLGHSHALSGLAAGAVTLPWAPVHGAVGQAAWVAAAGGFAMLPDLDQRGSTISRMWGPVSDIPAGIVGTIARGHRWGTHDAVVAPVVFGFVASLASGWFWSSLLFLAMSIGLALRALHFVIPGKAENTVIGNLLLSFGGAWLALENSPSPSWLPYAVMLGALTHIAGDLLTCEGVPLPVFWAFGRNRIKLSPMRTGTVLETAVLVPAFLAIALVFGYLNTPAHEAVDPLLDRIAALG